MIMATDYTIKQGDTLSAIAKANNTTVEALTKANQIADPNKINVGVVLKLPETTMAGADINASQIKGGVPNVEVPVTPTKTQTDANAISIYTDEQLKRIQAEKDALAKTTKTDQTQTTAEQLATMAQTRPTIDTSTKLKSELETTGATELSNQLQIENTKLGTLKGEVETLDTKEQNEIDALEGSGMSRDAIDREKTVIQRKFASQKALKNAEYSAQAATVAALQGNYQIAYSAAKDAVNAYTYDYQQNVKTFDTLFTVYSDALKDLDSEEQSILKIAAQNAQDELDKVTTEKTEVADLMIQYNAYGAGITLNDTLESAREKASMANETRVASEGETTGGMGEEELYSTLQGVEDYLSKNPDKSILDAVSSIPSAQRTNVLNAYYLNKAFQEEQISKPKNDALSAISKGDISETTVQNAITAGATNEEILSASGSNQPKAVEVIGKLSTKGREVALESAGKTTKDIISTPFNFFKPDNEPLIIGGKTKTQRDVEEVLGNISNFISPFLRGLTK